MASAGERTNTSNSGNKGWIRGTAESTMEKLTTTWRSTRRALAKFAPRPQAFGPAPDSESAAVRSVRNFRTFKFHYGVILWALLLASLAPHHRASMLFLMAASKALLLYGVLLKAFPNSALLRRLLDRRLVALVFLGVVVADLSAANAISNLLTALGIGVPVVLLHAIFRTRDDLESIPVASNGIDDDASVVEKKEEGDVETGPSRRAAAATTTPRSAK